MIKIDYFMSHGSPWTFLGHNRLNKIVKKFKDMPFSHKDGALVISQNNFKL